MDKIERRKIYLSIVISTIIMIVVALLLSMLNSCQPQNFKLPSSTQAELILRVIIQVTCVFIGFMVTALVMKFNQLDALIQRLAEDLNCIISALNHQNNATTNNNALRGESITETAITKRFEAYALQNPPRINNERRVFDNYIQLLKYRNYHKQWFKYPLYYSLTVIFFAFTLLYFHESITTYSPFCFDFALGVCFFMTIWALYINVSFVSDFLDNVFAEK